MKSHSNSSQAPEQSEGLLAFLDKYGSCPFEAFSFCEADALILARLSYEPFSLALGSDKEMLLSEAGKQLLSNADYEKELLWKYDRPLLEKLVSSVRYSGVKVSDWSRELDAEDEKQFGALTVSITDEVHYISFQGTDGTLTGWKEDFNMAYETPVPSQLEAVRYVSRELGRKSGSFMIGGHSKGGNLALYSASMLSAEEQERISDVYSFDGPGLPPFMLSSPGYRNIKEKLRRYIPSSALIGVLLECDVPAVVVESSGRDGLEQHDIYSWRITDGVFATVEDVDERSGFVQETISSFLSQMTVEERAYVIDSVHQIFVSTGAEKLDDLLYDDFFRSMTRLRKGFFTLDAKTRRKIRSVLTMFLSTAAGTARESIRAQHKAKNDDKDGLLTFDDAELDL